MGMTDPDASELESLVVDAQKVEPLGDRAPRLYALVLLSSLALNYSLYCLLGVQGCASSTYSSSALVLAASFSFARETSQV